MFGRRAFAVIAMTAVITGAVLWLVAAEPVVADAAIGSTSNQFSLASPAADITAFDLKDVVQVDVGGVLTPVMRFTMTDATLHGMTLDQVCRSSHALESSVPDTDTATLSGSPEIDVTTLSFTYAGTSYTFTPADALPPGLLPLTGAVTSVSMLGVNLTADAVRLTGFSTRVAAC